MSSRLISIVSILGFGIAAWLVYLFFESDSCMEVGGSFEYMRFRCNTAPDVTYTPLYRAAKPAFWAIYGAFSILAGLLVTGLLVGVVAGLRSLWCDVLRGPGRA